MGREGYRQPNENQMNAKAGKELNKLPCSKFRKRLGGPNRKGMADITGIIHGVAVEIEGKVDNEQPTPLQRKWLDDCDAAGAITGVYYSPTEAVAIVVHALAERGIFV